MNKELYYVLMKDNKIPERVAKKEASIWYGFEKDKWIEMPGLAKIEWDVTDYKEISKKEAEKFTKWQQEHWKEYTEKVSGED